METNTARKINAGIEEEAEVSIKISNLNVFFGVNHILKDLSLDFQKNKVNCIIGPSGSGKSTLLRSINRINDGTEKLKVTGAVHFNEKDILNGVTNLTQLRKDIGMVFQSPCVFPKSILENVIFGIQQHKKLTVSEKQDITEETLKAVSLWPEVMDRLKDSGQSLSIGQQQRLCIARTLATAPKVLLMDEPTSSLDPVTTRVIENLMERLKKRYTIVLVTHNIAQAKRISDQVFFMCNGQLIESGTNDMFFNTPKKEQTKSYLKDETCVCR
tara:strand:+ start:15871 stop:16683 length:813 start_codon:yes stop_codon:yes gene_type:complete